MTSRNTVIAAFLDAAGWGDVPRASLAGDASFRRYDRLRDSRRSAVLMDAPPPQEDVRPFVRLTHHLRGLGYSAPTLLAVDETNGLLLLEDLGDDTYTRLLAQGHDEAALYRLAVDLLAALHTHPDALPEALPAYSDEKLLAEAHLLVDWYMPAVGRTVDDSVRESFTKVWEPLLPLARSVPDTLVLRDFHVDNLLLLPREGLAACGVLDFQDAVVGPLTYDLVSLLEDARRDIAPALIHQMKERYWDTRGDSPMTRDDFDTSWAVLAAQRHAKVIGIFTRLCRRDGKPLYLRHIMRVWRLLEMACRHPALADLNAWLNRHIPSDARVVPAP